MTYTIWSNGGKFEWIIYEGDNVIARSGLIFNSRAAAQKAFKNKFSTLQGERV